MEKDEIREILGTGDIIETVGLALYSLLVLKKKIFFFLAQV